MNGPNAFQEHVRELERAAHRGLHTHRAKEHNGGLDKSGIKRQ